MDLNSTLGSTGITGGLDLSFLTGMGAFTGPNGSTFQNVTPNNGFLINTQPSPMRPQSNVIVFGNHRMMLAPAKPLLPSPVADSTGFGKQANTKSECKVKLTETWPTMSLPSASSSTASLEAPNKKASKLKRLSDDVKPPRKRKKVEGANKTDDSTYNLINAHQEMDAALAPSSSKKPKKQTRKSKQNPGNNTSPVSQVHSEKVSETSKKTARKKETEKKRKNVIKGVKGDKSVIIDLEQVAAEATDLERRKNDERAETMRQLGLILGLDNSSSQTNPNKHVNNTINNQIPLEPVAKNPPLPQASIPIIPIGSTGISIPIFQEIEDLKKPKIEVPRHLFETPLASKFNEKTEIQATGQPSSSCALIENNEMIDFNSFERSTRGEPEVEVNSTDIVTSPKWKLLSYRNSIYSYKSSENGRVYAFSRNSFKGRSVYLQALTKILFQSDEEIQ